MKDLYPANLEKITAHLTSAWCLQLTRPFRLESTYLPLPVIIRTPLAHSLYYAPVGRPLQPLSPHSLLLIPAYQPMTMAFGDIAAPTIQPANWMADHARYIIPTQPGQQPHINWINCQLKVLAGIDLSLLVNLPLVVPYTGHIATLFEYILQETNQPDGWQKQLLTHIISALAIETMRYSTNEATLPLSYSLLLSTLVEEKRFLSILQHVVNHLKSDLSNKKLAILAQVVEGYLGQYFKLYLPETPQQYVERCRLQEALQLLQTTKMPISKVSEAIGLSDTAYFCKRFKNTLEIQAHRARNQACFFCE